MKVKEENVRLSCKRTVTNMSVFLATGDAGKWRSTTLRTYTLPPKSIRINIGISLLFSAQCSFHVRPDIFIPVVLIIIDRRLFLSPLQASYSYVTPLMCNSLSFCQVVSQRSRVRRRMGRAGTRARRRRRSSRRESAKETASVVSAVSIG